MVPLGLDWVWTAIVKNKIKLPLKEDLFNKASNVISQGIVSWIRPQSQPQHLRHSFNLDQTAPKPRSHSSVPTTHIQTRTKPKLKDQQKSSLPKLMYDKGEQAKSNLEVMDI